MRACPLFPSQRPERRVIRLRPGAPALLAQPVPNEANANSAVVLAFQVPGLTCSPAKCCGGPHGVQGVSAVVRGMGATALQTRQDQLQNDCEGGLPQLNIT